MLLAAGMLSGCAQPIGPGLQSDSDTDRIEACIRAGQSRDPRYAPLLIELLDASSADVRFFAIRALEQIAGCTYDYRYYGPPERIAEDARRVRTQWLRRAPRPDR
jgi:hypothetical protein